MIAVAILSLLTSAEPVAPECALATELKVAPEKAFTGYAPALVVAERLRSFAAKCGLGQATDAATAHVLKLSLTERGGRPSLGASVVDVLERASIASGNAELVGGVTPATVDAALARVLPTLFTSARLTADALAAERATSCRALAGIRVFVDTSASSSASLAALFMERLQQRCVAIAVERSSAKFVVTLTTDAVDRSREPGRALRPFELTVAARLAAADGASLGEDQQSSTALGASDDAAAGVNARIDAPLSPAQTTADRVARRLVSVLSRR